MNRDRIVQLEPAGRRLSTRVGTPLQDVLLEHGVEFPCGGFGTCGKCLVRILQGRIDPCDEDLLQLGQESVNEGWRLACRGQISHDVTLQVAQWGADVLLDESVITVSPQDGWGVAVDLGTTTVAMQLVDLRCGNVLAVGCGLNPQTPYAADVMGRIQHAVTHGGDSRLTGLIRRYVGVMIGDLLQDVARTDARRKPLREVAIVGNTVMHHLFCGLDVGPLARSPFQAWQLATQHVTPAQLEWNLTDQPIVRFLPCLGGFIGSDLLAGVMATRLDSTSQLQVLVDLGTNGEIVVADAGRILCAATAAGPAFEGARIRCGMRASRGAIDRVTVGLDDARVELQCHVIGDEAPVGVCGSGLVDAAACALETGQLTPNGRLTGDSDRLPLAGTVYLHQCDFRELQLAKGAIAAGIEILLARLDKTVQEVSDVFLCGAFGSHLNVETARRIGLLPFPAGKVRVMGNTALWGAKLALLAREDFRSRMSFVCDQAERIELSEEPEFMDIYIRHMQFPAV